MSMRKNVSKDIVRCGRKITAQEINDACKTAELCKGLSRRELAETICEHWGWITATGSLKLTACLKVLEELELNGNLFLPPKRKKRITTERARGAKHTKRTVPPDTIIKGKLEDVGTVRLEMVEDKERAKLWNEYLDRYHYLGYSKPFGCSIRYFIICDKGVLGCILVAGAVKAIRDRDEWIGWSRRIRQHNLPWVINNTRFLIFPWVDITNLASHVLGQLLRRIQNDWLQRWGYEPLLIETFVDPAKYSGICYKAAGWLELGRTTGQGLRRKGKDYTSTPKLIYVKFLSKDFRTLLCAEPLQGRITE